MPYANGISFYPTCGNIPGFAGGSDSAEPLRCTPRYRVFGRSLGGDAFGTAKLSALPFVTGVTMSLASSSPVKLSVKLASISGAWWRSTRTIGNHAVVDVSVANFQIRAPWSQVGPQFLADSSRVAAPNLVPAFAARSQRSNAPVSPLQPRPQPNFGALLFLSFDVPPIYAILFFATGLDPVYLVSLVFLFRIVRR